MKQIITEGNIEDIAGELINFNLKSGNGLFVAPTAYNTAVIVSRKVTKQEFADQPANHYVHQVDALVNTVVVKVDGKFEGIKRVPLEHDFCDDYTVIALFDDAAIIIEIAPFMGAQIVDTYKNYAFTNLYSDVELLDI